MKSKIKGVAKSNQQSPALNNNEKPAKRITTKKGWNNLNVDRTVKLQLDSLTDLIPRLNITHTIDEAKNDAVPGCKVLFAGSGKGEKPAAKLIGKQNSHDVYRINVSRLVSNYTNEADKNLNKLLEAAEEKNRILFFDEADALFFKRTNAEDAHDQYANEEISYLLQRIKKYPGLIIFSSKNKEDSTNIFPIHFNTVIHFKSLFNGRFL